MSKKKEEDNIPQIVGLSKLQFFGFLLATIIMGGGLFGIGYTLAYFKKEKTHQTDSQAKNAANEKASDAKDKTNANATNSNASLPQTQAQQNANADSSESLQDDYNSKDYFVLLGFYSSQDEAKSLTDTLKNLGKVGKTQQHENYVLVYLGPYKTESIAQNEVDSIMLSTQLTGSIVRNLP